MKTASQIGIVKKSRPDKAATLAKKLARSIFESGDNKRSGEPCGRIQFMVGRYGDGERPNGGLCESALATHIAMTLRGIR